MKKLAFIDHSFKKQSLSSAFLINRLKEDYEVKIFWDESCDGGPRVDLRLISEGAFDILILFQQISYYTIDELDSLNCSVVLVPMFDADGRRSDLSWYQYRKFKFINFSKTIHQRLVDIGIESLYCQYFPLPPSPALASKKEQDYSRLKGFFWQRRCEITWNEIKKLIDRANFAKIHIHTAIDPPGYDLVLPSEEDRLRYEITTSSWFSTKDEYLKAVAESQVFFAPRLYEGIGMAFLEAMAMGKCVVAPNNPTMNEYITHGDNGLLYNSNDPQPLDFSNIDTICSNARQYMSEGFARWSASLKQVTTFIAEPKRSKFHSFAVLRKRFKLHEPRSKTLRTLKRWSNLFHLPFRSE
jgi:hypothetical protein